MHKCVTNSSRHEFCNQMFLRRLDFIAATCRFNKVYHCGNNIRREIRTKIVSTINKLCWNGKHINTDNDIDNDANNDNNNAYNNNNNDNNCYLHR